MPRPHANDGGDLFAGGDLRVLDCPGLPTRAPPIPPTEAEAESDEVDPDLDPEDAWWDAWASREACPHAEGFVLPEEHS